MPEYPPLNPSAITSVKQPSVRDAQILSWQPVQVLSLSRHSRYVAIAAGISTVLSCNEGIMEKSQKPVDILTGAHGSKAGTYDSKYMSMLAWCSNAMRHTADQRSLTLSVAR